MSTLRLQLRSQRHITKDTLYKAMWLFRECKGKTIETTEDVGVGRLLTFPGSLQQRIMETK